jgi:hypothetical protein
LLLIEIPYISAILFADAIDYIFPLLILNILLTNRRL